MTDIEDAWQTLFDLERYVLEKIMFQQKEIWPKNLFIIQNRLFIIVKYSLQTSISFIICMSYLK
jgi:hypothetical protein